ncbi:MAG TPA: BACON domain-containing carbohydrate-binding protein [Bryobacteraceae bacterium]|nr:BACON domain-containing carbohydrate-binding protein [Bryobacteraceae bacterium]
MMRWVLFLAAVGKLAAQGCGISVTTSNGQAPYYDGTNGSSVVPAAGATYTVNVNSPANCPAWNVTLAGGVSWITLGQTSGEGNSSFTFTVSPNTTNSQRGAAGTSLIFLTGGWQIPVVQAAAACTLTLPATSASAIAGGASGSFALQTGCDWNASSNVSWITVPGSTTGTGNGSVPYTVAANSCAAGRSGTITAGAGSTYRLDSNNPIVTFTVNQDGSANNLSISPESTSLDAAGGTGRVGISTGAGCLWSYYVDVSWIQIVNNGGGVGPSGISYSIPANQGPARVGHIVISSQIFTISQAGAAAPVPVLTAVVNAASYASGPVAPGEVVALGGTGLGPVTAVSAQLPSGATSFPATLAGVQVMFDAKYPAIPYYVSATQINAIAPYEIAGESTTQITVTYQGGTSAALQAQVQSATPGILTLDFTGTGQGAILNQDYSVNGPLSKAARGSVVMIYLIGAGATSPASADGSVTAGINALALQPVTVTIGGIPAQVQYAGGTPGAVAGLTQINAVVPAGVTPGSNVPVSIQMGSFPTQAGVTMAVN